MHMVFINKRSDVSNDRSDPDSGTKLAVIGTFIEGGRADDNPAYAPILNAIASNAKFPGLYGAGAESVVLSDLLPEDASTKFFTYPGSLTTPPCSQQVKCQHIAPQICSALRAHFSFPAYTRSICFRKDAKVDLS